MKARWHRPQVLAISQASDVLGDCVQGSTAALTSCADGQYTATSSSSTPAHGCLSGGVAGLNPGCSTGSIVP